MGFIRNWFARAPGNTWRNWVNLTVLVSRLGADRRARISLLLAGLTAPLRDYLPWRSTVKARLGVAHLRVSWCLGPSSDFRVLNDVFTHRTYDVSIAEPKVILDLGSHVGASLLYFRARYTNARIIGLEPDPVTLERLRFNAAQLGIEILDVAASADEGRVPFYPFAQGWASSLSPTGGEPIMVQARSLDGVLNELELDKVDLLKIDIEGAEDAVLRASRRLADIETIVGEFHGDAEARDAFVSLLADYYDVEIESGTGQPIFIASTAHSDWRRAGG